MNTKFDNRKVLMKLIEKLDTPDMMQMLAFAAGYEAGKMNMTSDVHASTQNPCPPADRSA